jgi:hypothetical protein
MRAVEATWLDLDHAAVKAANAFATHIVSSTTLVTRSGVNQDPLPDALDALDAARAKLRSAAGMPAPEQTGKALPAAQLVPILDGKDPIVELKIDMPLTAHGFIATGHTDHPLQVALSAGVAPKITRVGANMLRAVPDDSWGATSDDKGIAIGAIDAEGVMATPSAQRFDSPIVAGVVGSLADGVVLYGNEKQVLVARAKAGVVTVEPAIKTDAPASVAYDLDGRAAVVWQAGVKILGRSFQPGAADAADEPASELPTASTGLVCMTRDRAWLAAAHSVVGFGGGKPPASIPSLAADPNVPLSEETLNVLVGCTPDAVLLRNQDYKKPFTICTDKCWNARMPYGAPDLATTTVVNGKLVAMASHAGVLGVWREGAAEPIFYALPEPARPVQAHEWPAMAMTDGKVIDIVARGTKSFVLIRIPAT